MSSYQTTYDEPLGIVPHQVYIYASQIYHRLYHKRPSDQESIRYGNVKGGLEINHVEDEATRRQTFKLAYAALKYQDLLEDVIIESGFQSSNPLPQESMCLTVVAFYVLLNNKFYLPRRHRRGPVIEEVILYVLPAKAASQGAVIEEVQEVQDALQSAKTGLNATLARLRIRDRILTLDSLLPDNIRNRDNYARTLPVYGWVNTVKSCFEEVVTGLEEDGFKAPDPDDEAFEGRVYKKLLHFSDTLVFPGENKERLRDHPLVQNGSLILQDRSVAMPAYTIKSLLSLNSGCDVMCTHAGSGHLAAHVWTLLDREEFQVYALGARTPEQASTLRGTMSQMGMQYVKVLQENFMDIRPDDPRMHNLQVILLNPPNSQSGLCNPMESLVHGEADVGILKEFSSKKFSSGKLGDLVSTQVNLIKHAMGFPTVKFIVYFTSSVFKEENEEALAKAQEQMNPVINKTPGLLPFKVRASPLPIAKTSQDPTYVKFPMSSEMNGCFVGILERKGDTRELLARAQKFDLGI
ncbi:putative methyltransferase NSUN7 [Branchiostoma floridae]|uniref:Methyltransferase NSUN7 n=1 Tax=Branchiostoma floridae TaxID=7739 RepID=A0A9J7HPI0_BRAFL|nr:putative methyltransferase NSUN7 [Branchiostoma floridae]